MPQSPESGATGTAAPRERRLAAVAFADIVGYSILMAEDEERTHAHWMNLLNSVLRPAAREHRGRIVKSTGDGVLAEFPSVLDAVKWSTEVQERAEEAAAGTAAAPIAFRIAVHLGDVLSTEDDIYGDGVNVAARLQEHADPGGIVVSDAVFDLVRGSYGGQARDLGLLHLKNFENPIRGYALRPSRAVTSAQVRMREAALPSIAVLPLQNLSDNSADDYFAEGIVEDIIVSLAGLRELLVISRTSTVVYGKRQTDVRDVGRALGVRYVMTGSVRRSLQMVRVSVQLVDASTAASLWAESFAITLGELFEVQDRIVTRIVAGIAPHVRSTELQRAMRKRPENFTAYDYTLRALALIHSLNLDTFIKARESLERALVEDPGLSVAAAWLARWYSIYIGQGWSTNRREDAARAAELANRAIELDRYNALGLATYGHLCSYLFHDYDSALVYFERALEACPNSSLALMLSAGTLSYVGRPAEGVRRAEQALRLSPFDQSSFYLYTFLGVAHYASGAYQEAIKWTRMSRSENPRYTANLRFLIAALAASDRLEEAQEAANCLMSYEPEFSLSRYEQTLQPFRDPGIKAEFLAHLRRVRLPP